MVSVTHSSTEILPPPHGFVQLSPTCKFINRAAQFYARTDTENQTTVGTWITADQANSAGVAHGGFMLTFADFALSYILSGITLNLSADFLRPAQVGAWLEMPVTARRRSDSIIFADAVAKADGRDALRVSGIFRPYERRA